MLMVNKDVHYYDRMECVEYENVKGSKYIR